MIDNAFWFNFSFKQMCCTIRLLCSYRIKYYFICRANQDAQEELIELRREVGEFVRSVLNNPDNQNRTKQAT